MAEIRHLENHENRHVSTKKSSDFDEIWYINADLELGDNHRPNMKFFLNSRWRTVATLKIVFGRNSAADCPISVKLCVGKQFFTEFRYWDS